MNAFITAPPLQIKIQLQPDQLLWTLTCMTPKLFDESRHILRNKLIMTEAKIGIIGGSGLYEIEHLENREWKQVDTPFGNPSDEFLTGTLADRDVVFLPRHGRGPRILPYELNHRANICGMKSLGVEWIISVSAVGSLQEEFRPREILLPDQFIDRTKKSMEHTYFGEGIVAHIAFAEPICGSLRALFYEACQELNLPAHNGGTYVNMEGPAFSTKAESIANHQAKFSVIGMTNLGEAKCAREAEISYATLSMITDYDSWKDEEAPVTVEMVIENLTKNSENAKKVIESVVKKIPGTPNYPAHSALKNAIFTERSLWPTKTVNNLATILGKYL